LTIDEAKNAIKGKIGSFFKRNQTEKNIAATVLFKGSLISVRPAIWG
jgi:hypothetical protein